MRTKLILVVLSTFIFTACQQKPKTSTGLNGSWESIGSGWMLQITDSTSYAFYDVTSISCLPNRKGDLQELFKDLELKNDTLSLLKGVITYRFTRAENMPEICDIKVTARQKKDPLHNFEVFAETVKDHYAFFKLNGISWEVLYKEQKSKLNAQSDDLALYKVIEETLEKLNDNHANLEASEEVYEMMEVEQGDEEEAEENKQLPEYGDFQVAALVTEHHLLEEMSEGSPLMQWGKLTEELGYIQVKAMWLYADLGLSEESIKEMGYVDAYVHHLLQMYEGSYIEKEAEGVSKIMDKVMEDLADMQGIVIDVRFNGGGQDAVSFEILRRFIPGKLQIASQKLVHGSGYSPVLPLFIKGSGAKAYTKPVYVLTSQQSGSAAEAFAIATLPMDNVKRIGANTEGAMSTALEKKLPNDWVFTISNEIYMDNEGNSYENLGIPPDYTLEYPADRQTFFRSVVNDLEKDKMTILEAINALSGQ